MSTRANIVVKDKGLSWGNNETYLYRHCDGYPTSVLPMIRKAYELTGKTDWQAGRCAKVAAFLVTAGYSTSEDRGYDLPPYVAVEPTSGFHGDIEWLYVVTAKNDTPNDNTPTWAVEVYRPNRTFWDDPTINNCKKVRSLSIDECTTEIAEQIEGN